MLLHRRLFLARAGRATFGMLMVALSGCSRGAGAPEATATATASASPSELPPVQWSQLSLGLVSAYLLVRGRDAAIVDTGWEGSATAIRAGLDAAGLGLRAVSHVILTHSHPDHIGSLPGLLAQATRATAYAGEADVAAIAAHRPITPLVEGDEVFGLEVIATPGHTPGHIALLDAETGLLLAGDALRGTPDGGAAAPVAQFTQDMDLATESIRKLAGHRFEIALVGHGPPIRSDARAAVQALVERL